MTRNRRALASLVVGSALLAAALVWYVTALDEVRQAPREPLPHAAATLGLLAGGVALGAYGVLTLARGSRPAVLTTAGVVLLLAAGVTLSAAHEVRRREQMALDQAWYSVVAQSARRFPRALPGGRPAPAPLRGLPWFAALVAGGVILGGRGVEAWAARRGRGRKPGHA